MTNVLQHAVFHHNTHIPHGPMASGDGGGSVLHKSTLNRIEYFAFY